MHRRTSLRYTARALVVALAVVTFLATACSSGDGPTTGAPATTVAGGSSALPVATGERTFVGEIEGTDAFVALVTDGSRVLAYLCDGKAIWNYLEGTATSTSVRATEPGAPTAIDATIEGTTIVGTVTLDDGSAPRSFSAELVTSPAGVFGRESKGDGSVRHGGWIRLPSGEVRGKELTVDVSGPGTGTTTADNGSGSGVTVPPDAQPASILGLAACGIAGMRVAIAMNRFNRNQTQERGEAANEAIASANARCGAGAAA